MYKRWQISSFDETAAQVLCEEFGIEPIVARVCASRGKTESYELSSFLSDQPPVFDPFELSGVKAATGRIRSAVENGEKILVFGDYDCDGVTATTLMYSLLSSLGADVIYKIPDRDEGYGLSIAYVDYAKAQGVDLIITVDNGINCVSETEYATELGIDIVVTDHHMPQPELPKAAAVVDPHIYPDDAFFRCLAGVGVAFVVACGLTDSEPSELLWQYGDLVAIGTVADVMTLTGLNRSIVKMGLDVMNSYRRPGIAAVFAGSGLGEKEITASNISFMLAPRINASGRMGSAELSVKLLLCEDELEAEKLAGRVCEMNTARQHIEQQIVVDAVRQIESNNYKYDKIIVVSGDGWHSGVIGIAASRLVEKYARPVIVITTDGDISHGSGRGIKGFSLFEALSGVSDMLIKFGGHELAAGLTLKTEDIKLLRERLNAAANNEMPFPTVDIDCELYPDEAVVDTVFALSELEPFGSGNPMPVFVMKGMKLSRIVALSGGLHQKLILTKGDFSITVLCFGTKSQDLTVREGDKVDAAVTLGVNEYKGVESLTVYLKAIRICGQNSGELEAAIRRYESAKRGDISPESAARILPERQDFAAVYRALSELGSCNREVLKNILCNISPDKVDICIDSFCELGLVECGAQDTLYKTAVSGKVDLDTAPTVVGLRKIISGEK